MVAEARKFSDLKKPLSVVLEGLKKRGLLRPLREAPAGPAGERVDQSKFCTFHQKWGHVTDECTRLRHEIQDLIDSGRLEDPANRKPNVRTNPLPAHDKAAFMISMEPLGPSQDDFDVHALDIWDELSGGSEDEKIVNEIDPLAAGLN